MSPTAVPTSGAFTATGAMALERSAPALALLPDGSVLVVGGCDCTLVEAYDPASGLFRAAGQLAAARVDGTTATALADGRVLITGGRAADGTVLATAELYDPARRELLAAGAMSTPRAHHSATLLADGRVLVAGGFDGDGRLSSTELFDPRSDRFSVGPAMPSPRADHAAVRLPDGQVLFAGGFDTCVMDRPLDTSTLFDPVAGTFTGGPALVQARSGAVAVGLADGRMLLAGGNQACAEERPTAAAEVYDGRFTALPDMTQPRTGATGVLLPTGSVLVAGGAGSSAELFDGRTFAAAGPMVEARVDAAGILLGDGTALIAGGVDGSGAAELYTP